MAEQTILLEREIAAWLGAAGSVAAGFGRGALWLALEAVGVRGAEALVPDFICAQVPRAVLRAGARPVFYPVCPDLTIAGEAFRAAITTETRAVILPHYFGRTLPRAESLAAIARERGAAVIEDCALALGASVQGQLCGTFGDLAVFSFTKSDWCFGGGAVASRSPDLLAKLRALTAARLLPMPGLCFFYGLLKRADFVANRPRWGRLAKTLGRTVQSLARVQPENFYDAGCFDAAMPEFAARRARRLLASLERTARLRRTIAARIAEALAPSPGLFPRPPADPGDTGAFLLFQCRNGRAARCVEAASNAGIPLRLCWPAYQTEESQAPPAPSEDWSRKLLILEIHPRLSEGETLRIAEWISANV